MTSSFNDKRLPPWYNKKVGKPYKAADTEHANFGSPNLEEGCP